MSCLWCVYECHRFFSPHVIHMFLVHMHSPSLPESQVCSVWALLLAAWGIKQSPSLSLSEKPRLGPPQSLGNSGISEEVGPSLHRKMTLLPPTRGPLTLSWSGQVTDRSCRPSTFPPGQRLKEM